MGHEKNKSVKPNLQAGLSKLKKWWEEDRVLRCTLPFQRQAGVWNPVTKSNLVWSLISECYVPPITFEGFPFDIAGKKFSELEEELQDAVNQFKFSLQCFENYTMKEAESLFFHINSGVSFSAVQKSKAKMGTDMITYFNQLLGGTFFASAVHVTDAQARREERLLMLLPSVLLLDNRECGYPYKTISSAFCQKYAESLRDNYNEVSRMILSETIDYLGEAFQTTNKFLKKNNVPIKPAEAAM